MLAKVPTNPRMVQLFKDAQEAGDTAAMRAMTLVWERTRTQGNLLFIPDYNENGEERLHLGVMRKFVVSVSLLESEIAIRTVGGYTITVSDENKQLQEYLFLCILESLNRE